MSIDTDIKQSNVQGESMDVTQGASNVPVESPEHSYFEYQQTIDTSSKPLFSMIFLMFLLLVVGVVWASFFEISQSVRSQGRFIPSAKTQIVQVVDGGVLSELKVREGDIVEVGQVLAVLDRSRAITDVEESRANVASLKARLIRTQAEVEGVKPDFSSLASDHQDFVIVEQGLYDQSRLSLNSELLALNNHKKLVEEKLNMNQALYKTGDVSRLEVISSETALLELKGKISQITNEYRKVAQQEASQVEILYASGRFKLEARQIILDATQLVAPVSGIVKSLNINTIGGVLRAGEELMHISPNGDLLIELRLNPTDIGLLSLGMPAVVKVDAYDFSIYGSINGELDYISSDTLIENNGRGGEVFYLAQVKVLASSLQPSNRLAQQELKPGMTVSVDIQTGTRTVAAYLAKPIVRAFAGALTER